MPTNPALLKSARLFHLYSGVFFAPALLFFAFTGAVQTFSLHESTKGSDYKPPAILVKLAQLHKKQTLLVPVRNPPPPDAQSRQRPGVSARSDRNEGIATIPRPSASAPSAATAEPKGSPSPPPAASGQKPKNLMPMKYFFALTAWGLFLSTLSGLYMAYKYTRSSLKITLALIAGVAIPLLILVL